MTRVAWWHCFAGIAGDMALGSLIDAGADLDEVVGALRGLPIAGWSIEREPVLRAGIAATRILVHAPRSSVVRTYSHIVGLITEARIPERARDRSLAAFEGLATVEGRLHRRPVSQVHFHEVGSADAILDIVGTCVALELLEVDEVAASPVAQGTGMVKSAHGMLPIPAPAVVELLRGAPTYGTEFPVELTTPTGAALLAALVKRWGPLPAMDLASSGFGAGARDLDGLPNATQVVIGTARRAPVEEGQPVVLLETNLDDVTGEILAHTVSALIGAGALDAWITPIVGKKGRPAHLLSALGDTGSAVGLRDVMIAETGTLGVRSVGLSRWPAARSTVEVDVDGSPVRVKVASEARVKTEHDDAVRAARRVGSPAREVARKAEERARISVVDGPGGNPAPEVGPREPPAAG